MGKNGSPMAKLRMFVGKPAFLVFLMVLVGIVAGVLLRELQTPSSMIFQWLLAVLPGTIILTQLVFLLSSRKKQYRDALGPMVDQDQASKLEDLYFGTGPLTFRFFTPAILVTILCATIISALVDPYPYLPWLYRSSSTNAVSPPGAPPTDPTKGTPKPDVPGVPAATPTAGTAGTVSPGTPATPDATKASPKPDTPASPAGATKANTPATAASGTATTTDTPKATPKPETPEPTPTPATPSSTSTIATGTLGSADTAKSGKPTSASHDDWPEEGWTLNILRGSALGFLGAYVYLLLMLTDRARQRDITTGIATWAAAMPVLGLLMGGVAALIVAGAVGTNDPSWTRNAIFFVAGMLPRQFAAYVQLGVQRMFQQGATPTARTLPLTTLRGVGLDVQARLEEEGIHDVSALAYVSPHQLIRSTTYSPRQIVDWIDEALLVATVPEYWDALEKAGVTGALDLAWYEDHQDAIGDLATEIKMPLALLKNVVTRLSQDAQVDDLHQLYWDKTSSSSSSILNYRFTPGSSQADRDALAQKIRAISGVNSVDIVEDRLYVNVIPSEHEAVNNQLRGEAGIAPRG